MNRSRLNWLPVSIFLLLGTCYLLVPVGFLVIRALHRHMMWEQTEKASEVKIRVPARLFRWEIEGKEVRWQGRLFDVKHCARNGSFVELTGLFDEDEQRLEKDFSNLWDQRQQQGDDVCFSLGRFFQLLMYRDTTSFRFNEPIIDDISTLHIRNADPPAFRPHQPTTPPPELLNASEYNI